MKGPEQTVPVATRVPWARDDDDDDACDPAIPEPTIRLNREVIRDWINPYRQAHVGRYPTCALNCPNPPSRVPWRPWHPAMAVLCSRHRAQLYDLATATAERYHLRVERVLTDLLNTLIHLDREIDRDVN